MTPMVVGQVLGLMMTVLSLSSGFRIRLSGVAGYDDPYGLTNAFGDMTRSRRGDYRSLLRKRVLEDDSPYFDPNSVPLNYLERLPYLTDGEEESYGYIPDTFQHKNYNPIDEYPFESPILDTPIYGPQKRTPYSSNRVVPTLEELRTIFGEADIPMKRLPPVKRQEPKHIIKTADKASRADAVRKLLDAAEQLSEDDHDTNDDSANTVIEEATDERGNEFLDIATTDNTGDKSDELKVMSDKNGDVIATETTQVTGELQSQSKSKRASNGGNYPKYAAALINKIAELKKKVAKLEFLQMLQGKENDYLANALKFATLDQIEDEDEFIAKEYADINKATEAEALIQRLTENDEVDDDGDVIFADLDEELPNFDTTDADEELDKRAGIVEENTSSTGGQWLDTPVDETVGRGAMLEELLAEGNDEPEVPVDVLDDTEDDTGLEEMVDELDKEQEEEEEEEEEEQTKEKNLLAGLLVNLSPSTVESIIADLQASSSSEEAAEEEMCAPVLELSNHCAFADEAGIPIDADARNLCDRHQLCYTCGSAVGISHEQCDAGYKGTVIEDCAGDNSCLRDAAIFLRVMNRIHVYEDNSPMECVNPCVKDFIYGVAK